MVSADCKFFWIAHLLLPSRSNMAPFRDTLVVARKLLDIRWQSLIFESLFGSHGNGECLRLSLNQWMGVQFYELR